MQWSLYNIGKTDNGFLSKALEDYLKRLGHFTRFEMLDIAVKGLSAKMNPDEVKKVEGAALLRRIPGNCHLVLLDEHGKEFTSREFARWINQKEVAGISPVVFASGGAFGFSEEVYQAASEKIALSKMTFTHQMVRLFFVEQLYRGYAILKGLPYHND